VSLSILLTASCVCTALTNLPGSYESLPPNFSLLQNMAAGAFAGIAVCNSWPRMLTPF